VRGELDARGTRFHAQVLAPGVVAVARQHDQVGLRLESCRQQPAPCGRKSTPAVEVEGQAEARGDRADGDPAFHEFRSVGRDPVPDVTGHEHLAHHDLLRQHLPGFPGGRGPLQRRRQPLLLRLAQHGPCGVVERAIAEFCQGTVDVRPACEPAFEVRWRAAARNPRLELEQGGEVADLVSRPTLVGYRHPFAVHAFRSGLADAPVALGVGLVVLGAADPGVVGDLVVIPLHDGRVGLVQSLQVRVEAVGGMPQTVVGDRYGLLAGLDQPTRQRQSRVRVRADRVFVEVVADVHDQVEIAASARVRIGVEPAEGQVGAGKEADAEAGDFAHRQGARAPHRAHGAIRCDEPVEVPAARLEPRDGGPGRVVAIRQGAGVSARHDAPEQRVGGDLDAQQRVRFRRIARPQQHRARTGFTAGHAVGEAAGVQDRRNAGQGERTESDHACGDELSAIDHEGCSLECDCGGDPAPLHRETAVWGTREVDART